MQKSNQFSRTQSSLLAVVVVALVAITFFGDRGSPTFWQGLRVLSVGLLTLAAMFYLVKGVLAASSKFGGWKAASVPLCWCAALLLLAASQLWKYSAPTLTADMSIVAGVVALAAVVVQQRQREHAGQS